MPTQEAALTAIDLFCGAGGLSLAAKRLGIQVLAAVEYNSHACTTYRRNLVEGIDTPPVLYKSDIRELEPATLLKDLGIAPRDCDILMGGPPCQGYSVHRIKDAGVQDPRNELLLRYCDFVHDIKPRALVIENVPGILWPRHAKYLEKLYSSLQDDEYTVSAPVVLNAKDYGVPQNRKRVFILGIRNDVCSEVVWPPVTTHCSPSETQASGKAAWITSAQVFDAPLPSDDPNDVHLNHTKELVEVFARTPRNGGSRSESGRELPCHQGHNGHKDVYGRIDSNRPGPTMTTACVNPSKGRFLHPTENHGITLRHAARFQSFPDDFIFTGGLMAGAVQVGNAVPVLLGEAVLRTLAEAILDE